MLGDLVVDDLKLSIFDLARPEESDKCPQVFPPFFAVFAFGVLLSNDGSDAGTDLGQRLLEQGDLFLLRPSFGASLETLELLLNRSELLLRLSLVH